MTSVLLISALWLAASTPEAASIHERLGRTHEARGDLEKAAVEYERAIELDPRQEPYYFEAAHVRLQRQQFDASVKLLERGCKQFPNSAQLWLALGVSYYGQRRFGEAARAFIRTIDIAPEVQQPYVFLSKMLDQSVDLLPQIVSRFEKWAAGNPGNAQAQFVYAKGLLARGGDLARPEQLLRSSIRLKGDQWESHYELGVLLEKQRKLSDAAAEFERSIEISSGHADVHYHLARAYDRLGQPEKAAEQRELHQRLTDSAGPNDARR